MIRRLAAAPVGRVLPPLAIGFMVNFLLPGRAGEFLRAWLFGRREKVSTSAVFATVVVERLFDILGIICFLAPAPFLISAGDPQLMARIRWAALLLPVAYVAGLTALILLSHHREALATFLSRHPVVRRRPLLGRAVHLVERFCEGLGVLQSWKSVAGTVFLTLLIWSWGALANLVMMKAIDLDLKAYAPFFLVVLQGFGAVIPTPGFVGPFEYAHKVALAVYGVSETTAISLALLIHAGLFVAVLAPGFWYAAREHLGLRELTQASRTQDR